MNDWKQPPDYGFARFFSGIATFLGWVLILIGVGFIFFGIGNLDSGYGRGPNVAGVVSLASGLAMPIVGAFIILSAQFARSSLDTAEISWLQLDLQRQFGNSDEASSDDVPLRRSAGAEGHANRSAATPLPGSRPRFEKIHFARTIYKVGDHYQVERGEIFSSLEEAELHAEKLAGFDRQPNS